MRRLGCIVLHRKLKGVWGDGAAGGAGPGSRAMEAGEGDMLWPWEERGSTVHPEPGRAETHLRTLTHTHSLTHVARDTLSLFGKQSFFCLKLLCSDMKILK